MGIAWIRRARAAGGSGDGAWVRRGVVVAALAVGAGLLVGVSGASSPPSVDVNFSPLVPTKKVFSGTIGGNANKVVVVSGGTTTVPSNATTIQMNVTSKGTKAGTLTFSPNGNPSGSSGQTVSWGAGGSGANIITTDVGQKNAVAIHNASAATATVVVTILGYSTDVEVDDISSQGGATGQVLTDTGASAAWQDPQLPSAYFARNSSYFNLSSAYSTITSVTVPAGRYQVEAMSTGYYSNQPSGYFSCVLLGPTGGSMGERFGNVDQTAIYNASLAINGLVQTTGGTITLRCKVWTGAAYVYESTIMATKVGTTSGPLVTRSTPNRATPRQPGR
jgi:hypothetical protein